MENVRIFKSIHFNYLHLLDMISRLEQVRFCAPLGLNHPQIQCELTGYCRLISRSLFLWGNLKCFSKRVSDLLSLSLSECAPSTSMHVILDNDLSFFRLGFERSGFLCRDCTTHKKQTLFVQCRNCSLCPVGTYMHTDENRCLECPAGNENNHLFHL